MSKKYFSIEEIKRKMERYCVYQDRCHKDVEKKIYDYNLIPEAKEMVLLHLLEHDFLNEERFARNFARGKFRIKKWGKPKITRELKCRNISPYLINIALEEIDDEEYTSTLSELVEKKSLSIKEKDVYKRKKKLIDFLMYRGYETDLIYDVVSSFIKSKKSF